jgi:hypothetical protein
MAPISCKMQLSYLHAKNMNAAKIRHELREAVSTQNVMSEDM